MNSGANERSAEPNWADLPQEFQYLVGVTLAFAGCCRRFVEGEFYPTEEEFELLARTAQKIKSDGGSGKIVDWLTEPGHEEFWIIGTDLLSLLDVMGFALS